MTTMTMTKVAYFIELLARKNKSQTLFSASARMRKIMDVLYIDVIVVVLDNDALVHASTSSLMVRSYLTRVVFGRQE